MKDFPNGTCVILAQGALVNIRKSFPKGPVPGSEGEDFGAEVITSHMVSFAGRVGFNI